MPPGARREEYGLDESIWQHGSNAEVEKVWAEITAVAPPPALNAGLQLRAEPTAGRPCGSGRRACASRMGAGAVAIVIAAVVATLTGCPILILPLLAGGFVAGGGQSARRARDRVACLASAIRVAEGVCLGAAGMGARSACDPLPPRAGARLAQVRNDLLNQRRRYEADIAASKRPAAS